MDNEKKEYGTLHRLNLRLVVGLYRSVSRIGRSTQKLMAQYNLTEPQFGVMEALYHLGSMKIGDIIAKTLSTSGNMTVVIRNLEQEGWVNRLTDPSDKRVHLIQITQEGKKLMETVFPKHLQDLDEMLEHINKEEKEQLIYLLKKMNRV